MNSTTYENVNSCTKAINWPFGQKSPPSTRQLPGFFININPASIVFWCTNYSTALFVLSSLLSGTMRMYTVTAHVSSKSKRAQISVTNGGRAFAHIILTHINPLIFLFLQKKFVRPSKLYVSIMFDAKAP